MTKTNFLVWKKHRCLLILISLLIGNMASAQEKVDTKNQTAKSDTVQEVALAPQPQATVAIRKGVSVNKAPRSLFLIKRKIDESEFGEPTIYPFERHQRVISYDQRMEDPLSNQR